jgi:hypothetical protein
VTWFNALQLALAAGAALLIALRMRTLLFVAPLDAKRFAIALDGALAANENALARQIAQACAPSWPARLATAALVELERGGVAQAALEETQLDLEADALRGVPAIVALGRMASPLAFIGVMLEIARAFGASSGIQGLQRGLVASLALERALFTFALGAATFAVCFGAAKILQRRARQLRDDLERVASLFEPRELPSNEM